MKNQTKITYHGLVEITTKNKDGSISKFKRHNEGTKNLFKLFMYMLTGLSVSSRISSVDLSANNENGTSIISSPISGLASSENGYENITSNPCVKITAFIPFTQGITTEAKYLRLYTSEGQIAYINIENSGIKSIDAGQSLLINWYLYLDN